jgi:hypothetical protein
MYLPAEDAKAQHLLRRELGPEGGVEPATGQSLQSVSVALLHEVVHGDGAHGPSVYCGPTAADPNRRSRRAAGTILYRAASVA